MLLFLFLPFAMFTNKTSIFLHCGQYWKILARHQGLLIDENTTLECELFHNFIRKKQKIDSIKSQILYPKLLITGAMK